METSECTKKSKLRYFLQLHKQWGKQHRTLLEVLTSKPKEPVQDGRTNYNRTGVKELGETDFKAFVAVQDVSLVLFYSKEGEDSANAMKAFVQAEEVTDRPYSAYAKVDCSKEYELCSSEGITILPSYRMYSRGATVGTIKDYTTLSAQLMKAYVEKCPLLTEAERRPPKCSRKEF